MLGHDRRISSVAADARQSTDRRRRPVEISAAWSGRPIAIDPETTDRVGDRRPLRAVLCFGVCRLDRAMGLLHVDGEEVWLPPKALALLEYLVERPSVVVSRAELLAAAWEGSAVTDHSLTEAIRVLRNALGDDPRRPSYIQTVHKRGYRLVAEVCADSDRAGIQVRNPRLRTLSP